MIAKVTGQTTDRRKEKKFCQCLLAHMLYDRILVLIITEEEFKLAFLSHPADSPGSSLEMPGSPSALSFQFKKGEDM